MQDSTVLADFTSTAPFVAMPNSRLTMQVVHHLDMVMRSGRILPGGRVPSERMVAMHLKVSRNTVTAAFAELEERGLIRRIRGKGSFRCNPQVGGEGFSWSGKISSKAHLLDEPVLEMLARNSYADVQFPLSAGTPALECFPTPVYQEAVQRVIREDFPRALAVAPTEGQSRLRRSIAQWMNVEPNRVMITSGGQEAIDLLARCLIEPGDYAIVESPTYPGVLQSLRAAGARLVAWETDWNLESLEELLLRYKPKLLFTVPTFQNPTGKVMSLAVREGLLELAARYHLPILEDDVYSKTYLGKQPATKSLLKLDTRSQVIYISTFSKMLAPGLRIGWVVAPLYMVKQLSLMKMRANLFTDGLNQLVLAKMLDSGDFDRHLAHLRQHHCVLRNVALDALQPTVEQGLLCTTAPAGGLFLWCRLPEFADMDAVLAAAEARGVSLAPGNAFFPGAATRSYFRLCFTAAHATQLRRGVSILNEVLAQTRAAAN